MSVGAPFPWFGGKSSVASTIWARFGEPENYDASNDAFHRRLYSRHGKPCKCAKCGTATARHYDYANLTGRYEDVDDYAPMCRSCHWKFDAKINNIKRMRRDADDQAKSA
jgi:hypothetical protein